MRATSACGVAAGMAPMRSARLDRLSARARTSAARPASAQRRHLQHDSEHGAAVPTLPVAGADVAATTFHLPAADARPAAGNRQARVPGPPFDLTRKLSGPCKQQGLADDEAHAADLFVH